MDLSDESGREGEATAQAVEPVAQCGNVVGHLDNVVQGHTGRLLQLEEEQVRQGRLGPLDLGGEDRFLADVAVEEEVGIREECREGVEPAERQQGLLLEHRQRAVELERRLGRQRLGQEGPNGLAPHGRDLVATSRAALHVEAGYPGQLERMLDY
jgi:hypothetical protein